MQHMYSGLHAINHLPNILAQKSVKKIFLVVDKDAYQLSGAQERLSFINQQTVVFDDFEKNPKIEDIQKGIELFRKEQCDLVIAVGGGSVIDMAKSIVLLSVQTQDAKSCIGVSVDLLPREVPFIVIPTTAGSGSEATHFSVVYKNKIKYSLAQPSLVSDYVILDPSFTKSLPSYVAAYTGMDALCQGIESLWSVNSTQESRDYSRRAITLVLKNIVASVIKKSDASREQMLLASYWSGRAINIAKTTIAHSVSYPLTSFFGIPHGHAVALTLPYFVEFNSCVTSENIADPRGVLFVQEKINDIYHLFDVVNIEGFKKKFANLMYDLSLEVKLSKLGIEPRDKKVIVQNGFNPQRAKNNPCKVSQEDLALILERIG